MGTEHDVVQIKRAFKKLTLGLSSDQSRFIFETLAPAKYTENVNGVFLDLNDVEPDRLVLAYNQAVQFVDQDKRQEAYADQVRCDRTTQTQALRQSIKKQPGKPPEEPVFFESPEPVAKPVVYTKVQERLLKRCRELRPPGRNRHLLKSIVEINDDKCAGDTHDSEDDGDPVEDETELPEDDGDGEDLVDTGSEAGDDDEEDPDVLSDSDVSLDDVEV